MKTGERELRHETHSPHVLGPCAENPRGDAHSRAAAAQLRRLVATTSVPRAHAPVVNAMRHRDRLLTAPREPGADCTAPSDPQAVAAWSRCVARAWRGLWA